MSSRSLISDLFFLGCTSWVVRLVRSFFLMIFFICSYLFTLFDLFFLAYLLDLFYFDCCHF